MNLEMEEDEAEGPKGNKPDYKGYIEVAGWVKTSQAGKKFICLKIGQYCNLYKSDSK